MNAEVYQQLLETLAISEPGSDAQATVEELLIQQLDDTNPAVKLIAQRLAQRRAEESEEETFSEDEISTPAPEDFHPDDGVITNPPERTPSFRRLRQLVENMYEELDELRERNDALAAGVGACYLCWGQDRDCEVCQGRGQPGAFTPDRELFAHFVAPAVRRLRRQEDSRKEGRTHG